MNNEPVAWMEPDVIPLTHIIKAVVRREQDEQYSIPLYTHPVKELIKEEDILDAVYVATKEGYGGSYLQGLNDGLEKARAILRKASEK